LWATKELAYSINLFELDKIS